jgi:hypothetical protein
MARREVGTNARGILPNPTIRREIRATSIQEGT